MPPPLGNTFNFLQFIERSNVVLRLTFLLPKIQKQTSLVDDKSEGLRRSKYGSEVCDLPDTCFDTESD